jgi:hypothetical protein
MNFLKIIFIFVSVFSFFSFACHPLCTNNCSDVVCRSPCQPICKPLVCNYIDVNSTEPQPFPAPTCHIYCPPDQCESDACPACTALCINNTVPGVEIECDELECAWKCEIPSNCSTIPGCVTQCDVPACEALSNFSGIIITNDANHDVFVSYMLILIIFILVY